MHRAKTMLAPLRSLAPLSETAGTPRDKLLAPIAQCFARARAPLIITGAGISTGSGIPDYRSPDRPAYTPLNNNDFLTKMATRRRYWARSFLGYARMSASEPNAGHVAIARLLLAGRASLVTQNVDRLHHKAVAALSSTSPPSERVPPAIIELHGTIHEVSCLQCGWETSRAAVQTTLKESNAGWCDRWLHVASPRPDGDVDLPEESYAEFTMPACLSCGAELLKPRVVFFGGVLEPSVREAAAAAAAAADLVLLVGTTVTTFSAFRLARDAASRGARVAIINFGLTRADELLSGPEWKVEGHTSPCLEMLAEEVLGSRGGTGVGGN